MQVVEKHVLEVAKLAREHCGLGVDVDSLTSVPWFSFPDPNRFQKFLIAKRIIPFLVMKLLYNDAQGVWMAGHGTVSYWERRLMHDERDIPPEAETKIGPTLIDEEWLWQEVFNSFLRMQGFPQLIIKDAAQLEFAPRFDGHATIKFDPDLYDEVAKEVVFVRTSDPVIAVSERRLYYDGNRPESVREALGMIVMHKDFFEQFLRTHGEIAVDHDIYLGWLMSWFPDMIHIRSLK